MAADLDFRKLKRGQLCNHFRPTGHLTTKVGLLECLRDYVAPQGTGVESPSDDPSEATVEASSAAALNLVLEHGLGLRAACERQLHTKSFCGN